MLGSELNSHLKSYATLQFAALDAPDEIFFEAVCNPLAVSRPQPDWNLFHNELIISFGDNSGMKSRW